MCAMQVTDENFESTVLQSELPVLVDFWAPWCGPCRALTPVIDELAKDFEGRVTIVKMNVDENSATAVKYGIKSIPTLILFKKGDIVEQLVGAASRGSLTELLTTKA